MNELPTWAAGLAKAVGAAAVLASGTTLIATAKDVAVLQTQQAVDEKHRDEVLAELEKIDAKVDRLLEKVK